MTKARKFFTTEEKVEAVARYRNGETAAEVAKSMGCSSQSIVAWAAGKFLKERTPVSKPATRRRKFDRTFKVALAALVNSGNKRETLCKIYDLSHSVLSKWVKQHPKVTIASPSVQNELDRLGWVDGKLVKSKGAVMAEPAKPKVHYVIGKKPVTNGGISSSALMDIASLQESIELSELKLAAQTAALHQELDVLIAKRDEMLRVISLGIEH